MLKIGICNELFEGVEFGQVCRLVKSSATMGLKSHLSRWRRLITD